MNPITYSYDTINIIKSEAICIFFSSSLWFLRGTIPGITWIGNNCWNAKTYVQSPSCGLVFSNICASCYLITKSSRIFSDWHTIGNWWVLLKRPKEVSKEVAGKAGETNRKNSWKQKEKRSSFCSSKGLFLDFCHVLITFCFWQVHFCNPVAAVPPQEPIRQDIGTSNGETNDVTAIAMSLKVTRSWDF